MPQPRRSLSDTPPNYAPVGQAYSYTYAASTPPGEPNATFALASGKLPPGLTLNATTGVLSGTPTSSGTFTFVVQTQNAVQRSVSPLTGITTLTPTVSRVSPNAGPTSGGGTVTITGTGFVPGARVAFGTGNYAGNVTYKSATSLTATVPPHAAAVVDVSVLTGGGTSPTGQADLYAYGAPTVTKVSPNAGSTAGGGTVTITGTGFVPGSIVEFGSVALRHGDLRVRHPPHRGRPAADRTQRATSASTPPAGYSPTGQADRYAYGAPTVTKVSPNAGSTAGGGTVTITGTGFVPGSIVEFGSVHSATVTYVSATRLTAVAPPQTARDVDIRVYTPAGYQPHRPGGPLRLRRPHRHRVSPTPARPRAGARSRSPAPGSFPAPIVEFGSVHSATVTYVSPTELTASRAGQTASPSTSTSAPPPAPAPPLPADTYAYGAPTVTAVSPNAGSTAGGGTVTISGTGFVPGSIVEFGSVHSATVTYVSTDPADRGRAGADRTHRRHPRPHPRRLQPHRCRGQIHVRQLTTGAAASNAEIATVVLACETAIAGPGRGGVTE